LLPGASKRFAPKASESRTAELWLSPQRRKPVSCNLAEQARAAYGQDQDMAAASPIVTHSRDGATLGSRCQWKGKGEDKASPGLLSPRRRKQGSWATTGFVALDYGGHGRRLHSGAQTQPLRGWRQRSQSLLCGERPLPFPEAVSKWAQGPSCL